MQDFAMEHSAAEAVSIDAQKQLAKAKSKAKVKSKTNKPEERYYAKPVTRKDVKWLTIFDRQKNKQLVQIRLSVPGAEAKVKESISGLNNGSLDVDAAVLQVNNMKIL